MSEGRNTIRRREAAERRIVGCWAAHPSTCLQILLTISLHATPPLCNFLATFDRNNDYESRLWGLLVGRRMLSSLAIRQTTRMISANEQQNLPPWAVGFEYILTIWLAITLSLVTMCNSHIMLHAYRSPLQLRTIRSLLLVCLGGASTLAWQTGAARWEIMTMFMPTGVFLWMTLHHIWVFVRAKRRTGRNSLFASALPAEECDDYGVPPPPAKKLPWWGSVLTFIFIFIFMTIMAIYCLPGREGFTFGQIVELSLVPLRCWFNGEGSWDVCIYEGQHRADELRYFIVGGNM